MVPESAIAMLVLAHGAGAGFDHANLTAIAEALARRQVATLRFNFPFMQAGRRRVDAPDVAVDALRRAAETARERLPALPLFLGGHSFGGRMASHAVAQGAVRPEGLVCCSFPLHPAGRPGSDRAAHLAHVEVPMLFLSGTRDALADPALLDAVVKGLGTRATLVWLDDADHGYRTRKTRRQDPRPVFDELADGAADFMIRHI
jgi:hypothetical protein